MTFHQRGGLAWMLCALFGMLATTGKFFVAPTVLFVAGFLIFLWPPPPRKP